MCFHLNHLQESGEGMVRDEEDHACPSGPATRLRKQASVGSPSSLATPKATPKRQAKSPKCVSKNAEATPRQAASSKRKSSNEPQEIETIPTSGSAKRTRRSKEVPCIDQIDGQGQCKEVDRVLAAAQAFNTGNVAEAETPICQSYFEAKVRSSTKKSAKKISDINVVEEQELREALTKLDPKHQVEQAALLDSYKTSYQKWHFQLRCGFGLLMYGFGSKRSLLEDFASTALVDGAAVVVNGYLPTINLKQVVYTLVDALCQQAQSSRTSYQPSTSHSLDELLGFLTSYQGESLVYLIVHSIDGPGLRDGTAQQLLAKLAACSPLRLVASIDNINAPLLWDKRMANTQFNWWWHHTPTYASYTVEAAFVPLLLAAGRVNKSVRSAILVLQSLTPNAQSVFKVLADHQLANPEDEGLTQHQLYTKCRERFLVSSELTLRAHLTEFKDHQLVRVRRGSDGQDCLYITLPADALTKLLEDLGQLQLD